ncbi:hypothetical protein GCK72_026127 [Caenorhabditis remanei]|uniref:Inhibitor of growth protein n=1 Tax=Caenorhabditis remanei TaxID=31234 RepID=A0A6A5G582_CAERE|nr:hypothetical protein GCK72_026127 [Caenorhabditis remanei]KAF1749659.1 hypothetical protein GCK72_026127 [Caenorhabditis remanei]
MDSFYVDLKKEIDNITISLEKIHVELPPKIKEGMEKIGVLDRKVAAKMEGIETTKAEFVEYFKEMDQEQKVAACKYIEKEYQEASDLSERKIKIAEGIRKAIEKVKREFQEGTMNFIENYPEPEVSKARKPKKKAAKKEKKQPSTEEPCSSSSLAPSSASEVPSKKGSRLKKKKVAEEEQLWCYCREEKPGEMIFCEDPECAIQWFHFECIGMKVAPEGDWFCKECLGKMLEDPFDDEPAPEKKSNTPKSSEKMRNDNQEEVVVRTPKKVVVEKGTVEKPDSSSNNQKMKDAESNKESKTITEGDEASEEEPEEPVIKIVSTPDVVSFEEVA